MTFPPGKLWRRLDSYAKGGVVYFVVAMASVIGGVLGSEALGWPDWTKGVIVVVGILFAIGLAWLTVNRYDRQQERTDTEAEYQSKLARLTEEAKRINATLPPTPKSHDQEDRNCIQWRGDPKAPTDLSHRCLICCPKTVTYDPFEEELRRYRIEELNRALDQLERRYNR